MTTFFQTVSGNDNVSVQGSYNSVTIFKQAAAQAVDEATLKAAHARLDQLPTDTIPLLSPNLPPGSKMPFLSNPNFVGREEELKGLAVALKEGTTSAITATTGIGGIGKSQLAIEFVFRYGSYFSGGVYWLSFADPESIPAEIATCGGSDGLNMHPQFANLPVPEQVRYVSGFFKTSLPKLLVFDNCEDADLIDQWHPKQGGSRILVTSRKDDWPSTLGITQFPLQTLSRGQSVKLLLNYRPDLDAQRDQLEAIANELGDLPLALHLAGNFLRSYQTSSLGQPASYLEQLTSQALLDHPSLQGRGSERNPTERELNVAKTFALSYDRLDADDPTDEEALKLLARAAYFAPGEPIPSDLLIATLHPEQEEQARGLEENLQIEDALKRLTGLGLLEREDQGELRLHRLIAAFVQSVNSDSDAKGAVEQGLLLQANRLNNAGYPAPLLAWQPHLRFVTDKALAREGENAAALANTLGFHLNSVADYAAAKPYYERALEIYEKVLGPEYPNTALSLNNLGYLLRAQGDYAAAKPYFERALEIYEKVLGPEYPNTALSLNNLGYLLRAQGDYAAAKPYFERALEIYEKVLGPEHPDTASSLNNLGSLLRAQGDYAAAKPYYERALEIYEKVLGPEHPDTASSLNNLAGLLDSQGDYAAAKPYYERALEIFDQALGANHPHTQIVRRNLQVLMDAMSNSSP